MHLHMTVQYETIANVQLMSIMMTMTRSSGRTNHSSDSDLLLDFVNLCVNLKKNEIDDMQNMKPCQRLDETVSLQQLQIFSSQLI
jgi:hypothetical protein